MISPSSSPIGLEMAPLEPRWLGESIHGLRFVLGALLPHQSTKTCKNMVNFV